MAIHIGIYGGGQLGMFLCRAARSLGLHTTVVTPQSGSPACSEADRVLIGPLGDLAVAAELVSSVDLITFELEAIPGRTLDFLMAAEARHLVEIAPQPALLRLLQNKASQKRWLNEAGLPTAPFRVLEGGFRDLAESLDEIGFPFVQKMQQGGYDGLGVQVIRRSDELHRLWVEPSIVEAYIPDAQELAVIVARGRGGQVAAYDPVSMDFNGEQNVLETVRAPAPVATPVQEQAKAIAIQAVQALGGVGVFAVELFLDAAGNLLINEISARVHNAGHHTLEACATSQFEQHLRAIAGLPLGSTAPKAAAVTRNLLWDPALSAMGRLGTHPRSQQGDRSAVHWYGKAGNRAGRKVGHITCLGEEVDAAWQQSQQLYHSVCHDSGKVRP